LRTSNDAAVSIVPPIIPQGGFSPLRLEGWRIRRDLPGTSFSLSLLPAYTVRRPVCLRPSCFSVDPPKVGSVDAMYCTAMRWNAPPTPGVLAPDRVMLSRSIITYSTPSAPLAGTSQLHRTAAYMRCLSCGERLGHPRAVPGFRCTFLPDMPSFTTPGSSTSISSRAGTSTLAFTDFRTARHSQHSRNPVHAGFVFRGFSGSHIATACQVARPPVRI